MDKLNKLVAKLNSGLQWKSKELCPCLGDTTVSLMVPKEWMRGTCGEIVPKLSPLGEGISPTEEEIMVWMEKSANLYEQSLIETQKVFGEINGKEEEDTQG